MSEGKKLYYRAVDGSASGVIALPKDMNEPVDLLGERRRSCQVKILRHAYGTEYRLMKDGSCLGCFTDLKDLRLLKRSFERDLKSGRVPWGKRLTEKDRAEFREAVEAIEEAEKNEALRMGADNT